MLFEIQILYWHTFHGISTARYSGRHMFWCCKNNTIIYTTFLILHIEVLFFCIFFSREDLVVALVKGETFCSLLVIFCSLLLSFFSLLVSFFSLVVSFCSLLVTFCLLLVNFLLLLDKKYWRMFLWIKVINKKFSILIGTKSFMNNLKTRIVLNWRLSTIFMGTKDKITWKFST